MDHVLGHDGAGPSCEGMKNADTERHDARQEDRGLAADYPESDRRTPSGIANPG